MHLHGKHSEVCIKTRSTPASLSSKGQVSEQTTVKWSIVLLRIIHSYTPDYLKISKQEFSIVISHGLKWGNQLPKLKWSIEGMAMKLCELQRRQQNVKTLPSNLLLCIHTPYMNF